MTLRRNDQPEPTRGKVRYRFAVPMIIELPNGFLRPADRVEAFLVDLSTGGAALVAAYDRRYKHKRRFRVSVDDHSGIIEIRNISPIDDQRLRLGVQFSRLGLELQELVDDSLDAAQKASSRIRTTADQ